MKRIILLLLITTFISSCNKDVYGVYNTKYSTDKSSFFEIILNKDNSFEKKEIHLISIYSKGKWIKIDNKIILFAIPNEQGFPADTLVFKIIGKKLFPVKDGVVKKNNYYKKNNPKPTLPS